MILNTMRYHLKTIFVCGLVVFFNLKLVTAQADFELIDIPDFSKISLSLFGVVTFPNLPCQGVQEANGTCYTNAECESKGGTATTPCAQGYGVCCVFYKTCGETISENLSYFRFGPTNLPPRVCRLSMCKCSPDVCRMRLDFTTFTIVAPISVDSFTNLGNVALVNVGDSIGDCRSDYFFVRSQGLRSSPMICGFNTGQHMYTDVVQGDESHCPEIVMGFSPISRANRDVDIRVTQYVCGDEHGGPPGCLQYFTQNVGTVVSYAFRTFEATVRNQVTHLSSQHYRMCFRRNSGKCALCLSPHIAGIQGNRFAQTSFGLSRQDQTGTGKSLQDGGCFTDWLSIPNGQLAITASGPTVVNGVDRFCGRYLNVVKRVSASSTVCTPRRPFMLTFHTDDDEMIAISLADATPITSENEQDPTGLLGFWLDFWQIDCT